MNQIKSQACFGRSNNKSISAIFVCMLMVNLLPALLPFYAGGPISNYGSYLQVLTNINLVVNGVNLILATLGLLVHFRGSKKVIRVPFLTTLLMVFFLNVAFMSGGYTSGRFLVFRILLTFIFLFSVLDYYRLPEWVGKYVKWTLFLWAVIPILLFWVYPPLRNVFGSSYDGSFGGFSAHKNAYGVLVGIAVILILPRLNLYWLLGLFVLLYGVLLSQSRATMLSIFAATTYYLAASKRQYFKKFFAVVLIVSVPQLITFVTEYGVREIFVDDARSAINQQYIELISGNVLLGSGGNATIVDYKGGDMRAHNFLLQSWADYGMFFVLAYLILLAVLWRRYSNISRALIIFMVIFGLFQPYMDPGGLGPVLMLCFLLITYYGPKRQLLPRSVGGVNDYE
ncbi:MAG: hypothetical protein PHV33_11750 [Elusimicrobiales bacterium]|nr:hypothetical protein [Elusimicrobiales bacterium]